MKKIGSLIALGVLAYVVFAVVTLPAAVVLPRVQPEGMTLAGLDGTVWKGSAEALQIAGTHVGSIEWDMRVLELLTLRAAADINVKRTDGFARAGVSVGSHRVALNDVTASLPLTALPPQLSAGGWTGTLNARLESLELSDGWPVAANGTIDLVELTGPARRPVALGTFQVKLPVEATPPNTLAGSIRDIDGPLQIDGKLQLNAAARGYEVGGFVTTKPGAPAEFQRTLEMLGPADGQGRREFSFAGTM